jgi:hypothetical protein
VLLVYDALLAGPLTLADLTALVAETTETPINEIVDSDSFGEDAQRLADTLVATKIVSGSAGTDARGLAMAAQGYDALASAAGGADPVRLRALVVPDVLDMGWSMRRQGPGDADGGPAAAPLSAEEDEEAAGIAAEQEDRLRLLDEAIIALGRITAASFVQPEHDEGKGGTAQASEEPAEPRAEDPVGSDPAWRVALPWQLSADAVRSLPEEVQSTVDAVGVDLTVTPLPAVLTSLHEARARLSSATAATAVPAAAEVHQIGSSFRFQIAAGDDGYVGLPGEPMPTSHGSIRPVGIGDLLLVKQHVLRYEGGELAHVENVLKSEHLSRETRRLERTETVVLTEQERTKEEERG